MSVFNISNKKSKLDIIRNKLNSLRFREKFPVIIRYHLLAKRGGYAA